MQPTDEPRATELTDDIYYTPMTQQRTHTTRRRYLQALSTTTVGATILNEFGSDTARGATGESWPQFSNDAANTGHAPENTGPVADVSEQWRFETGDTSPVVMDGTVYVGGEDGKIYALDASDGTEEWRFETGSSTPQTTSADSSGGDGTTVTGGALTPTTAPRTTESPSPPGQDSITKQSGSDTRNSPPGGENEAGVPVLQRFGDPGSTSFFLGLLIVLVLSVGYLLYRAKIHDDEPPGD